MTCKAEGHVRDGGGGGGGAPRPRDVRPRTRPAQCPTLALPAGPEPIPRSCDAPPFVLAKLESSTFHVPRSTFQVPRSNFQVPSSNFQVPSSMFHARAALQPVVKRLRHRRAGSGDERHGALRSGRRDHSTKIVAPREVHSIPSHPAACSGAARKYQNLLIFKITNWNTACRPSVSQHPPLPRAPPPTAGGSMVLCPIVVCRVSRPRRSALCLPQLALRRLGRWTGCDMCVTRLRQSGWRLPRSFRTRRPGRPRHRGGARRGPSPRPPRRRGRGRKT